MCVRMRVCYSQSSPALVNGVVYVASGNETGPIAAINATTGAVLWMQHVNCAMFSSIAVSLPAADGAVSLYVGTDDDSVVFRLDAATGNITGSFWTEGDFFVRSSPCVDSKVKRGPCRRHSGPCSLLLQYTWPGLLWSLLWSLLGPV